MNEFDDIPTTRIEQIKMLENLLIARATGSAEGSDLYENLRETLMSDLDIKDQLPSFVITNRSLQMFWQFIKYKFKTYEERRQYIHNEFNQVIDHLSSITSSPSDEITEFSLNSIDTNGSVISTWEKALERRERDPEGAITLSRTLLETVIKHILDEIEVNYSEKDDLPKLYNMLAERLNLLARDHEENAIKSILQSVVTTINGLGTLRNRLSDAHGVGAKKRLAVRPTKRHATLAINTAGNLAIFLIETFNEKKEE